MHATFVANWLAFMAGLAGLAFVPYKADDNYGTS
jgi:hypothetical protein